MHFKTNDKISLENKLKTLESNILLLENKDNQSVVANNIKVSKIKEIKMAKQNIVSKLVTVEEQISCLINSEQSSNKNFNVKSYLENFEKDKKECEKLIGHLKEKSLDRENKAKERLIKVEEEHQNDYMRLKTEEKEKISKRRLEHLNISKKMLERNLKIKRELDESLLLKNEKPEKYLHTKLESDFIKRENDSVEKKKKEDEKIQSERKELYIPIRIESLIEHTNQVNNKRKELLGKLEKTRLLREEEIKKINEQMVQKCEPSLTYNEVAKNDQEMREKLEKHKLEQKFNNQKIKKYSNIVSENMLPIIDELKRKQIIERIEKLNHPKVEKHHYEKNKEIKLVKFTDESKKKYKWDVDLKKSIESIRQLSPVNKKYNTKALNRDESKIFHTEGSDLNQDEIQLFKNSKVKSHASQVLLPSKRTPLLKKPDYLTTMRKEDEKLRMSLNMTTEENNKLFKNKWEKIMNRNNNIYDTIEDVKSRTKVIEERMNYKEKYLKLNGGAVNHPEIGVQISQMLTHSIQAKLLLLEKMNE